MIYVFSSGVEIDSTPDVVEWLLKLGKEESNLILPKYQIKSSTAKSTVGFELSLAEYIEKIKEANIFPSEIAIDKYHLSRVNHNLGYTKNNCFFDYYKNNIKEMWKRKEVNTYGGLLSPQKESEEWRQLYEIWKSYRRPGCRLFYKNLKEDENEFIYLTLSQCTILVPEFQNFFSYSNPKARKVGTRRPEPFSDEWNKIKEIWEAEDKPGYKNLSMR